MLGWNLCFLSGHPWLYMHTATHINTLQHTLQHTLQRTCWLRARHTRERYAFIRVHIVLQCAALCCSVLPCIAVCCSVLQLTWCGIYCHVYHVHYIHAMIKTLTRESWDILCRSLLQSVAVIPQMEVVMSGIKILHMPFSRHACALSLSLSCTLLVASIISMTTSEGKDRSDTQYSSMLDARILMHPDSDKCVQPQARFSDSRLQSQKECRFLEYRWASVMMDSDGSARQLHACCRVTPRDMCLHACASWIIVALCTNLFGSCDTDRQAKEICCARNALIASNALATCS